MIGAVRLTLSDARELAAAALANSGASPANAVPTAHALVAAEADGQVGHGLSRVPSYAAQVRTGKVNGQATPVCEQVAPGAVRIDAAHGFAYPAIDLAVKELCELTARNAVAVAAIHRSHHFGQAGAHAERLARSGLLALAFGNSPRAMPFWGGRHAMLGTNPIAFACPLTGREPLVIDLALSKVARGKIMAAHQAGDSIPEGWALDASGLPTTDAGAALAGSMLPIGGPKGAALALMVEILAAALTGSRFGWEASSFLDDRGEPPGVGQVLLAFDPLALSGGAFPERINALLQAMAEDPEVRVPGERRLQHRRRAQDDGLLVSAELCQQIRRLATNATGSP